MQPRLLAVLMLVIALQVLVNGELSMKAPITGKTDVSASGGALATPIFRGTCSYGCEGNTQYDVGVDGNWDNPKTLLLNSNAAPGTEVPTRCRSTIGASEYFPSLFLSNLTLLNGTNYKGIDRYSNTVVCVSITEVLIAFPQPNKEGGYTGACPPGPPYRSSCPMDSSSTGTTIIVLPPGNLPGDPIRYFPTTGLWPGNWIAISDDNRRFANTTAFIVVNGRDSISLKVAANFWYNIDTGKPTTEPYGAWGLDIYGIRNKESPGYFVASSSQGPVCFIWTKEVFAMTWTSNNNPCPTAPYIAYNSYQDNGFNQQVMRPY